MALFKKKAAPVVEEPMDLEAVMKKYDRESNIRVWEGAPRLVVQVLLALFSLFVIYVTLFTSWLEEIRLTSFMACIVFVGFLVFPVKKGAQKGEDKGIIYTNKTDFSDYYLEDGSYLKLDNITIGYTFRFKENKYAQSLRLYATAQNLFTISKYSGQDPEVNTTNVWGAGIDPVSFYPSTASCMVGVNLTLF